jgi:hypothetical protein
MTLEDTFAKVVGRQASEPERARLHQLRDALGLRDNDAFWSIVMALEYYDSFFRRYPAELAEQTARCLENVRNAFAAAADKEAAQMQRMLSEKIAETSVAMAHKLARRPPGLHWITTALAAAVAFGALCASAGYSLAMPERPFWAAKDASLPGAERMLAVVLALPAGWMIFAFLLPPAAYGAKLGWELAGDPTGERRDKLVGWCVVAVCISACIACAVMLAKVT